MDGNNIKKYLRLSVFLLGITLTIVSFYLDNAKKFPQVTDILAPDYAPAKEVLKKLDKNEKVTIPISSKGGKVLLNLWPTEIPEPLESDPQIKSIGRWGTVISVAGRGGTYYILRLNVGEDESRHIAKCFWKNTEAYEAVDSILETGIFKWKSRLFLVGIIISFTIGLFEYFKKANDGDSR